LIYRCVEGHISFARELARCGMKGCEKSIDIVSEIDIEWFYRISLEGLAINEADMHRILEDRNMPTEVKDMVRKIFPHLKKKGIRFW
jgi:hypothetical protein